MSAETFSNLMWLVLVAAIAAGLLLRRRLLKDELGLLKKVGVRTEAEVTEVGRIGDLMEGVCVTYQFIPEGRTTAESRTEEYSLGLRKFPVVGARYPVLYDPKNPSVSRILLGHEQIAS